MKKHTVRQPRKS
ncbi:hypothetical protein R3I94_020652 [Phoxinus phoxinus]